MDYWISYAVIRNRKCRTTDAKHLKHALTRSRGPIKSFITRTTTPHIHQVNLKK